MDYYIQGSPDRAKEIKAAFEKLGFDPAGWDCDGAHSVYFTVPGDNKVKSLHISIGKVIMTHPDYQELELPAKPNFKVGDWVVTDYGKVSQVVSVDKDGDGYTLDDGIYFSGSWCDMYHHWAISDVKDGDVLTDGKKIVIFNKFEEPTRKQRIIAYAGLDLSGKLQITEETKDSWRLAADRIMPATKEQCGLLFQKIKEEGYQWDAEKKELRKIIKPHYDISNFKPFDKVLVRDADDGKWRCNWFSHYSGEGGVYRFVTTKCGYVQCIPFNEYTEHLLGTTDMCPDEYVNWQ
jgi:hypothetical protein